MACTSTFNFCRKLEETKAAGFSFDALLEDLTILGYASLGAAAAAVAGATVHLIVEAVPATVAATVTVVQLGDRLQITLLWQPPVSLTDTVQEHTHRVVYEPGSTTSEWLICEGLWTVEARRAVT